MKTKIFKMVLPVFAFMLAIGGAFAFNQAPADNAEDLAQVLGHYKVNNVCEPGIMCQDDTNTGACQLGSVTYFRKLSTTNCSQPLWQIIE